MAASNLDDSYVHGLEDSSDYCVGGYHPVHIQDRLHDRYRVLHKLGHGSFSTAWLAMDEEASRYVAVKVGRADAGHAEGDVLSEITQSATNTCSSKAPSPLLPDLLDRFDIAGSNGTHPCLVTPAARCSLRDAKEASGSGLFRLDTARSLAAQFVMAVSIVHSRRYAHGDLHLGNILLHLPSSFHNLSIRQLHELYGAPAEICPDSLSAMAGDGAPSYLVPRLWLGVPSDELTLGEAKVMLTDFGVSFRPDQKSRVDSYIPLVLRPPEAFFEPTTPLAFSYDIWSMGCVIFEILAHRSLIDGFLTPQDEITAQQVQLQGPLPAEWWAKWEERPKWYNEVGKSLSKASDIWPWGRRFELWVQTPRRSRGMETMSEDERDAFLELLRRMLAWRPDDRPDVEMVLRSDWMMKWALPAYQQCLNAVAPVKPSVSQAEKLRSATSEAG